MHLLSHNVNAFACILHTIRYLRSFFPSLPAVDNICSFHGSYATWPSPSKSVRPNISSYVGNVNNLQLIYWARHAHLTNWPLFWITIPKVRHTTMATSWSWRGLKWRSIWNRKRYFDDDICVHTSLRLSDADWHWEMCGRIESCLGTIFDIFVAFCSDHFLPFQFVSHPNIQQLLASLWYEGVPGFRRKTSLKRALHIAKVALLFPYYCLMYMLFPYCKAANFIRKPFMKFLIHASSYLFFLCTCIFHTV